MAGSVVEWKSSSPKIRRVDHDTSVVSRIQQHAGIFGGLPEDQVGYLLKCTWLLGSLACGR